MELKKNLRPTMVKTNARFRGLTSSLDYVNMVNEAVHDITLLGKTLDETDEVKGQSTFIRNNFNQYVSGVEEEPVSNIPSSSVMYAVKEDVLRSGNPVANLLLWEKFGGCTTTEIDNGYRLAADGTMTASGIRIAIDVEPGDLIMMRFAIAKESGFVEANEIRFGSPDVNNIGNFHEYTLSLANHIGYVDRVIECLYRESIHLEIGLIYDGFVLGGGTADFLYPEIRKVHRREVSLLPMNLGMKDRINNLDIEIKNLAK